jgi:hypothetical protein
LSASALRELDARLRGGDVDVPFQLDAASLRNGLNFTFKTKHGDIDCLGDPGGGFDYEILKRNADRIEVENLSALREVRDRRP